MTERILFWHRKDLRISDNAGLAAARQQTPKVTGVFCLDPGILGADDVAPARLKYMLGSLSALQQDYRAAGGELLILQGKPEQQLLALAQALDAKAVYWSLDVEPYAKQRDETVRDALKAEGITAFAGWDQLLHAPGDVRTGKGDPYTVYGPFWKKWIVQDKSAPVETLSGLEGLTPAEQAQAEAAGAIALPSLKDLGLSWDAELPLAPGSQAAYERLEAFCDGDQTIVGYDEQRNFPAVEGTSFLSAALKFGTIGIRRVWQLADEAYGRCRSDEARKGIRTWQQELAWREFYQHALYFFPDLAQGPYREQWKVFPWENNEDYFQAWCEGRTGYPIVDAAMRQLNETGWMHNRCRMIVASFLTKDLIIDWRWGEKYFMQKLVDGDLAANNGGWQWSASSGMDPKPLRIFNPYTQAQKFDRDGEYIRQWVPELNSADTSDILSGQIGMFSRGDYPEAIVIHKERQREFKALYATIKK